MLAEFFGSPGPLEMLCIGLFCLGFLAAIVTIVVVLVASSKRAAAGAFPCPHCGGPLPPGVAFCPHCGRPPGQPPPPAAPPESPQG